MPALSLVKKESVGLEVSRMGTKENKIAKAGRPCSWDCYEKKTETYCYSEIFFLEILISVKAGRVNWGARKVYHGRRVGQACCRDYLLFLLGIESRFFGRQVHRIAATPTELSRLQ
jgi:hypothetical protein